MHSFSLQAQMTQSLEESFWDGKWTQQSENLEWQKPPSASFVLNWYKNY